MAFAALGLDEAQQRTLEGAVRGLADQARNANAQRLRDLEQEVQTLRTQAGAPAPPHPSRGDPPDARLGKPTVFTGHEGKWDQWYFKARAYLMCMGGAYPAMIAAAEAPLDTDVSFSAMTPEEGSTARKLFLALVMLTEESALRLVQTVQDSNGVEALRRLLQRFNPITQGRVLATLNGILQADFGADEVGFLDRLTQWDQKVQEFEQMSRQSLPDLIKRAIITERAPVALRTHLLVNAQSLTSYGMVRAAVESFVTAGRRWDAQEPGSEAMEVDAQYDQKDGKGKTRKGGGKKGKDGNGKGGRRKGSPDEERPEKFEGYCIRCGKWGHRQRDCWSPKPILALEAADEGGTGETPMTARPGEVSALTGLDEDDLVHGSGWILAIGEETDERGPTPCSDIKVLVDSGASEHVCGTDHFNQAPEEDADPICLRTATGHTVTSRTARRVRLITRHGQVLTVRFRVADVARPVISVSRLGELGMEVLMWKGGGRITRPGPGYLTLQSTGRLYFLDVRLADMKALCAPVGDDGRSVAAVVEDGDRDEEPHHAAAVVEDGDRDEHLKKKDEEEPHHAAEVGPRSVTTIAEMPKEPPTQWSVNHERWSVVSRRADHRPMRTRGQDGPATMTVAREDDLGCRGATLTGEKGRAGRAAWTAPAAPLRMLRPPRAAIQSDAELPIMSDVKSVAVLKPRTRPRVVPGASRGADVQVKQGQRAAKVAAGMSPPSPDDRAVASGPEPGPHKVFVPHCGRADERHQASEHAAMGGRPHRRDRREPPWASPGLALPRVTPPWPPPGAALPPPSMPLAGPMGDMEEESTEEARSLDTADGSPSTSSEPDIEEESTEEILSSDTGNHSAPATRPTVARARVRRKQFGS